MRSIFLILILFSLNLSAQVTLNLKLFIEGYYSGSGMMDNFGSGGCLFINNISSDPTDADTVKVSLAQPSNLSIVDVATGILKTDGSLSVTYPSINPGNSYFIRITHRNALAAWSHDPVVLQAITTYDFSDTISKAAGNNMCRSYDNMVWMLYSGDISDANNLGLGLCYQDGMTEAQDILDMENAVAQILTGYNCQDITGDGIVEGADWLIEENAVAAMRYEMQPNPISVNEIKDLKLSSKVFRCLIVDGKILTTGSDLKKFSLYDLQGRKIAHFDSDYLGKISVFNDGVYILHLD